MRVYLCWAEFSPAHAQPARCFRPFVLQDIEQRLWDQPSRIAIKRGPFS